MKVADNNYERVALSIHRVEVTEYRNDVEREKTEHPFDCERQAKFNFDGIAHKSFKHLLNNWSMSQTKVFTRIELIVNDTVVETIYIQCGK